MKANNGEPCRFCGKTFEMTNADVRALRRAMLSDYGVNKTDAQVAKECDICPSCAGINKEGAE